MTGMLRRFSAQLCSALSSSGGAARARLGFTQTAPYNLSASSTECAPSTPPKASQEITSTQLRRPIKRRALLAALASLPFTPARALAARRILLCYLRTPPPSDALFYRSVITSLEEFLRPSSSVVAAALTLSESPPQLHELVRTARAELVIAIGGPTLTLLQGASLRVPLLAGATPIIPSRTAVAGLSTIVDPVTQLQILTRLAPGTRRVFVVHAPRDAWLITLAQRAAVARGMRLESQSVSSARTAAVAYLNTIRGLAPGRDALWLLPESEFLTTDLVQAIVEQSWSSSALVYSSVLSHVAQGVLFATYPDARRIAQRLARMAALGSTGIALDNEPNTAVNVRTATHLVSRLDMSQLPGFTIRFGER